MVMLFTDIAVGNAERSHPTCAQSQTAGGCFVVWRFRSQITGIYVAVLEANAQLCVWWFGSQRTTVFLWWFAHKPQLYLWLFGRQTTTIFVPVHEQGLVAHCSMFCSCF